MAGHTHTHTLTLHPRPRTLTHLARARKPAHTATNTHALVQPPKRMGASIDADGKSNIWAVEPKVQVINIHARDSNVYRT